MMSPLNVANLSVSNVCLERSISGNLTGNLSLNFTLGEFASGMESVNNLYEEELGKIDGEINKLDLISTANDLAEPIAKIEEKKIGDEDCPCWTSKRMKEFIKYMRSKVESPLVEEIERLSEKNKQLNHDLQKNLNFIDNNCSKSVQSPEESEKLKDLKKKYSERLLEIHTLNKKIANQSLNIEEYIKNEETNYELISKQSKGN